MITEDYCSYEVAKLLKEKEFKEPCIATYNSTTKNFEVEKVYQDWTTRCEAFISAPTHQIAMKWLREKYNIYISIQPDFPSDKDYKMCWCWSANTLHENCISMKGCQCYMETYKEAVEAALKYTLKKLI